MIKIGANSRETSSADRTVLDTKEKDKIYNKFSFLYWVPENKGVIGLQMETSSHSPETAGKEFGVSHVNWHASWRMHAPVLLLQPNCLFRGWGRNSCRPAATASDHFSPPENTFRSDHTKTVQPQLHQIPQERWKGLWGQNSAVTPTKFETLGSILQQFKVKSLALFFPVYTMIKNGFGKKKTGIIQTKMPKKPKNVVNQTFQEVSSKCTINWKEKHKKFRV